MRLDFGIRYGDTLLDIEDSSVLTVEWYSTVFNENEIFRGSYSYPINLKWTEKNLVALGFPNVVANRLSRDSVPVTVFLHGSTWKNATMDIEVSYQRIVGTLQIDNGVIADTIRDNTLPDMFSFYDGTGKAYETIEIGENVAAKKAHMLDTAIAAPNVYPYAFPSQTNFNILGERNLTGEAWVNSFNWVDPFNTSYHLEDGYFYCPSFYMVWLIKTICQKMGFEAEGTFLEHPEVLTWQIFNTGYYSSKAIKSDNFKIVIARHLPKITVSNFFKQLRNDLKILIYFDSLTRKAHFDLSDHLLNQDDIYSFNKQIADETVKVQPNTERGYTVVAAIDDGDEIYKFSRYVKSLRVGTGELKKVELAIGSPIMNTGIFSNADPSPIRNMQVAQVANIYEDEYSDMSAYNKPGELSVNEFTFRIFSFRGLQQNTSANPMFLLPYATTDNRNAKGEVVPEWIPTVLGTDGYVALFCRTFYQFLCWTETIEFDSFIPAHSFFELNPMKLGMYEDTNGLKNRFLIDRISFEALPAGERLFAKVKGYLFHKIFGIIDTEKSNFLLNEFSDSGKLIYVGAMWDDTRVQNIPNTSYQQMVGKVKLMFYSDPYGMIPVKVSNLTVNYKSIWTWTSTGQEQVFDLTMTTGTDVSWQKSEDEKGIWSNEQGASYTARLVVVEVPGVYKPVE